MCDFLQTGCPSCHPATEGIMSHQSGEYKASNFVECNFFFAFVM